MKITPRQKKQISSLILASTFVGAGSLMIKKNLTLRQETQAHKQIIVSEEQALVAQCTVTCLSTCGVTNKC